MTVKERMAERRAEKLAEKEEKKLQDMSSGLKQRFGFLDLFMYLFVGILSLICLYPFLNVIAYSLSDATAVLSGTVTFFPKNFTLSSYKYILSMKSIWNSMGTTIAVTLLGTAVSLVLTTAAAYALSRNNLPGRKVIAFLILFTMYFGGGTIPTFLVVKGVGLYDTLASLVLPQAVSVYNFVVMRTFFRGLPESLEEAAQIDGATDMQVLFRIVLPLSVPIMATIGLFYAVQYWNSYFDALIYITDDKKYTLQLRLRSLLFGAELNPDAAAAGDSQQVLAQSLKMCAVAVATVPIICVYPWLQKYFVKGALLGSVKG